MRFDIGGSAIVKYTVFIPSLLAMTLCGFAAEPGGATQSGNAVIVEINGAKITLNEFEQKSPTALFQARNSFYEAQKKAIDAFVEDYLVQQQAKKENLTVIQLFEKHVSSKVAKDPSDEALRVYYEGVDTTEPFEGVRDRIIAALRERRITKIRNAYIQSLREQANIVVRVSPPRAAIATKDLTVRGTANAPVTLVEYADYECPYCQQIKPVIEKLQADFQGKLAFVYKDLPLNIHANAQKAAEATRCAESQGKYWEFHDALYAKKQLDVAGLKATARDLKLDVNAFDKCLDSGEKAQVVRTHMAEAQSLALQGTPTFFVNGRQVGGNVTYESLRAMIEEELKDSTASSQQQTAKR
jgi:protein-disulfide isomerase